MAIYSKLSKSELITIIEGYDRDHKKHLTEINDTPSRKFALGLLQTVLDTIDEPVFIVEIATSIIILANKKTTQLFGPVIGKRCWEKLQKKKTSACTFCTNPSLLDQHKHANGVHKSTYRNNLIDTWYQCNDQALEWIDGTMVAIKTAVDIGQLIDLTEELDSLLTKNKIAKQEFVSLIEKERRQLSHDLHDEMGQIATAIKLNAGYLSGDHNTQSDQHHAAIADIEELSTSMLDIIRGVSNRLNPRNFIGVLSIPDMLQALFDDWISRNIQLKGFITFEGRSDIDVDIDLKQTLYRICQEALTNITKHAKATQVDVNYRIYKKDTTNLVKFHETPHTHIIELDIQDNGVGFNKQINEPSLGLKFMSERIELHNGLLLTGFSDKLNGAKLLVQFPYSFTTEQAHD